MSSSSQAAPVVGQQPETEAPTGPTSESRSAAGPPGGGRRSRRKTGSGRSTSGRTLVLLAVVGALLVMLVLPVRNWLGQRDRIDTLNSQVAAAQDEVAGLLAQRDRWNDPTYVEEQARLRLNLVRPGEAGLVVLEPGQRSGVAVPEAAPDTWWGRLWESVDERSGRLPAGTISDPAGDEATDQP